MKKVLFFMVAFVAFTSARGQQVLGSFSGIDTDEWPNVYWYRDTNNGWDEGLIKNGSGNPGSVFGRAGFGIHMDQTRQFSFWSTSWTPLFSLQGGTGNAYLRGALGIGGLSSDGRLSVYNNSNNATNLVLSANYLNSYRWRFNTVDRGNAIDMDITASNGSDQQESILKLSPSYSGRAALNLMDNWLVANGGKIGIGLGTQVMPNVKLQVNSTNPGNGYSDWVTANFGAQAGDRVVMGLLNGVATIGAHNNGLSNWSNLTLNPEGSGKVGIGTYTPGDLLTVNGNIRLAPLNDNTGLLAYDAPTGGNHIYSLTRQSNNLAISAFDAIGFSTGTNSPSNGYKMLIGANGNVGIGTINPVAPLTLAGRGNPNPNNTGTELDYAGENLTFRGESPAGNFSLGSIKMVQPNGYYLDAADMVFSTSLVTLSEKMRITHVGNVVIGATDPKGYKLAVAGNAIAEQMTVKLHANWPDYIFNRNYVLMPLPELKDYIDRNHHLPEIPSAADVEKDGLNLGEINKVLVKKVEELTLYLIDQKKELADEKEARMKLEQRIKSIEGKIP